MLKIAIILGSTRPGRNGEAVAKWVYEIAQKRNEAKELSSISPRYRLFQRSSGIFFVEDRISKKQESLKTRDKIAAQRIFNARNESPPAAGDKSANRPRLPYASEKESCESGRSGDVSRFRCKPPWDCQATTLQKFRHKPKPGEAER